MKRYPFFCPCLGLVAVMVLVCLTLFPGAARAAERDRVEGRMVVTDDLTQPTFRTTTVGACPKGHTMEKEWEVDDRYCSRARLIYPRYKKIPWLDQLIDQSVILPMFAERLGEEMAQGGSEALYKDKLTSLVHKGGVRGSVEKVPLIEFAARLAGHETSPPSQAGLPRPEVFGPYLQFVLEHELSQRYDAHPPGSLNRFIVIDTRGRKVLTFGDLILPGQEKALEDLQLEAFRAWLKTELKFPDRAVKVHLANPSYTFRLSRNWRIAQGGLMFRFALYEVGPRPFGSPEIIVKKERLHGIIQPNILEQIPTGN